MEEKVIVKKQPKSPALSGVLSFFFPGVGSLYNGQTLKGFFYIIVFAGLVTIQTTGQGQPFAGLILGGFYFYQIIETIQSAKGINRRALLGEDVEKVDDEDELSAALKTGSIFWGAVLLVLGGILLLANFGIISYETVFDFWPLVVIVIGVKFILEYLSKDKKEVNGGENV
ncbi:LiaI-LiaF-like domain-containing protein [Acidobacteriota bacterium]